VHLIYVTIEESCSINSKWLKKIFKSTMKKTLRIKIRDLLIILGIVVALLIGLSTQWAIAGEALFGSIIH